ncbi:antibiotic biosynthesis monooxygenase [Tabrizicola sp. DMG-N-6]|uniref:Antibiotic biosynthesis monooxygenase n=1 Tax=Szabonella alba TaxID=2804194 RepID=A0A8K0V8Q8_9RHOB|nr:antibiotic biosynthesis monooxygenase [Szabonella alba]
MIRLTGRLICADADEARIVAAFLPDHIRLSRAEPGCLRFDAEVTDDPLIWRIAEEFGDEAAFDAHRVRNRASVWWQKSQAIRRDFHKTAAE